MDKPKQPNRFSLAQLFAVTTLLSLALASGLWATQSTWDSSDYLPWIIVPSIPMMGSGLLFAPWVCLAMIISVIVLMVRSKPRPLAPIYFLALLPFVMFVEETAVARYLLVLLIASATVLAESTIRKLDPKWWMIAGLCFATTFGYYWFMICALACAGV